MIKEKFLPGTDQLINDKKLQTLVSDFLSFKTTTVTLLEKYAKELGLNWHYVCYEHSSGRVGQHYIIAVDNEGYEDHVVTAYKEDGEIQFGLTSQNGADSSKEDSIKFNVKTFLKYLLIDTNEYLEIPDQNAPMPREGIEEVKAYIKWFAPDGKYLSGNPKDKETADERHRFWYGEYVAAYGIYAKEHNAQNHKAAPYYNVDEALAVQLPPDQYESLNKRIQDYLMFNTIDRDLLDELHRDLSQTFSSFNFRVDISVVSSDVHAVFSYSPENSGAQSDYRSKQLSTQRPHKDDQVIVVKFESNDLGQKDYSRRYMWNKKNGLPFNIFEFLLDFKSLNRSMPSPYRQYKQLKVRQKEAENALRVPSLIASDYVRERVQQDREELIGRTAIKRLNVYKNARERFNADKHTNAPYNKTVED